MIDDLISIIVPVYNAELYLKDTINTIKNQTYKNWEAIFVDDASDDNSCKIIQTFLDSRIKLIRLNKNYGPAYARNKGIEAANGRYIAFLDADDLWKEKKLELQHEFIKKNNYAFIFTGYEFADKTGLGKGKIVYVPDKITYKQALGNTTICTITVMCDLMQIDKELLLMPNVRSEDSATWWKILRNGFMGYGLNISLAYYRRTQNSMSSNKLEAIKATWNIYRNLENLSYLKSSYYFVLYIFNAIRRRM